MTHLPLPDSLPAHPRLHITSDAMRQLSQLRQDPWFTPFFKEVESLANQALDPDQCLVNFNEHGHNWHLQRARHMQTLSWTLAVQAILTDDPRYLRAAMRCVQIMHDWEYWSWIAWRNGDSNPVAIYDLSYGENTATLAVLHDWLADRLTAQDIALFIAAARRPIDSFLHWADDAKRPATLKKPWWLGNRATNWNAVCCGGAGLLALSLAEHLPEAQRVIDLTEASLKPFMENLAALDGAWPEGIGYWNYGIRYAYMYFLAHEHTTGQPHWAMGLETTAKTLHFPVDFTPHGVPCSFGDVNRWSPLPLHHLLARRVNDEPLAVRLQDQYTMPGEEPSQHSVWPHAAETLLMVRTVPATSTPQDMQPRVTLYDKLGWGVLTSSLHQPRLSLAVRGGSTIWPHAHMDLTSFHAVVRDEHLIFNPGVNEYLDTTSGKRRFELYDTTPPSKNILLVNGLGMPHPADVVTQIIRPAPGLIGLQIDASSVMGQSRGEPAVKHYCRAFLMIQDRALLVLDHIILPHEGRCESRLHTHMTPSCSGSTVALQGLTQHGCVKLACSEPANLHATLAPTTTPREPVHMLRWITQALHTRLAFATLMLPDDLAGDVAITTQDEAVRVTVTLAGQDHTWLFNAALTHVQS